MQKNDLYKCDDDIYRILSLNDESILVINCNKRTMPVWIPIPSDYEVYCEEDLLSAVGITISSEDSLSPIDKKTMHERYSLVAPILPFVDNECERSEIINRVVEKNKVCKATIRKYLCMYLVFQDITVLAPSSQKTPKTLTSDEKNYRWSLNKFYYTYHKNSLKTAYTMMLKERYTDKSGILFSKYPKFHQFRYFYDKHKNLQTYYISRNGLSSYQRNNRPLLGDGIQSFCPSVGTAMLDATTCDIYLINDSGTGISS